MRVLVAMIVGLGGALFIPAAASAIDENCSGGSEGEDIVAGCETTDPPADPDDGESNPYPDCRQIALTWAQLNEYALIDPNIQFGDGYLYFPEGGQAMREAADGTVERGELRLDCASNGIRWIGDPNPPPDPVDVSVDEARERVPTPELDISPGLAVGGVVNLGMWLAVANGADITATATGRGTSVTATASLAETEWDMGDGTTITCAGGGEPIDPSDLETIDAGPCGHTYGAPSDGSYTITVTATWEVTWVATDGRSGTAPPVVQTDSFDYEVIEIQTVGRG